MHSLQARRLPDGIFHDLPRETMWSITGISHVVLGRISGGLVLHGVIALVRFSGALFLSQQRVNKRASGLIFFWIFVRLPQWKSFVSCYGISRSRILFKKLLKVVTNGTICSLFMQAINSRCFLV